MSFKQGPFCVTCKKSAEKLNLPELKRCSHCKSVYYCARNCQRRDFNHHNLICKRIKQTEEKVLTLQKQLQDRNLFDKFEGKFLRGNALTIQYYHKKYALTRLIWMLALENESYEAIKMVKCNLIGNFTDMSTLI